MDTVDTVDSVDSVDSVENVNSVDIVDNVKSADSVENANSVANVDSDDRNVVRIFGFYRVCVGFIGFWWVLVGFIGLWWALVGFGGLWWVVVGFRPPILVDAPLGARASAIKQLLPVRQASAQAETGTGSWKLSTAERNRRKRLCISPPCCGIS